MPTSQLPLTMRAWQYDTCKGGIENHLSLNPQATVPEQKPQQNLIQTIAATVNPVDYKVQEAIPFLFAKRGSVPGADYVGRIIEPAKDSKFTRGQLVFGVAGTNALAGGSLAEYCVASIDDTALLPDGVDPVSAACVGMAGITAYQSIVPYVSSGQEVFINGGSGGTGTFGIQLAKAVGCHVTATCSTGNIDLCKDLGADEVIDYKTCNILDTLVASGRKYDHIVDYVGNQSELYFQCHKYTNEGARYIGVGTDINLGAILSLFRMLLQPSWLGGGRRKFANVMRKPSLVDLEQLGQWMRKGLVKAVVQEQCSFTEVPKAFKTQKGGRTKGKIVINVVS